MREWAGRAAGADRLVAVLGAGYRLTTPAFADGDPPAGLLAPHPDPERAIRVPYVGETVDLAARSPVGSFTTAEYWRSRPRTAADEAGFGLLRNALADPDRRVAGQAAYFLDVLGDPRTAGAVERYRSTVLTRELAAAPRTALAHAWVRPGGAGPRLDAGVLEAVSAPDGAAGWRRAAAADGRMPLAADADPAGRPLRLVYWRLTAPAAGPVLLEIDPPPADLHAVVNGRPFHFTGGPAVVPLEPGSNDVVLGVGGSDGAVAIAWRAAVAAVASAPPPRFVDRLAARVAAGAGGDLPAGLGGADWDRLAKDGDPEAGRRLFGRDGVGCVRCHAIVAGQAGDAAPNLAGAGKKFTPAFLAESILTPSKVVDPLYKASRVVRADGTVLTGLVVERPAGGLTLLLPNAARVVVAKDDVEDVRLIDTSPMPAGLVRTRQELADLLAYLTAENPAAP